MKRLNDLDNDYITLYTRKYLNCPQTDILKDFVSLAELGQINAIIYYFQMRGRKKIRLRMDKKIETSIDKKTVTTYFEKYAYFNKLSAEVRLGKNKKILELIENYNAEVNELSEIKRELESDVQKSANGIKTLERKSLDKQMECDLIVSELCGTEFIKTVIDVCKTAEMKLTSPYTNFSDRLTILLQLKKMYFKYGSILEGKWNEKLLVDFGRKIKSAYEKNPDNIDIKFAFAKYALEVNSSYLNKTLANKIFEELANRSFSQKLSEHIEKKMKKSKKSIRKLEDVTNT